MKRFVLALLLCAPPALARAADAPKTGPWDVKALASADVKPEWGQKVGTVREVYYPGEPFGGKPTRVFAYYARPAKGDGPFPAVLLVHGGGGKAFSAWAEHWANRGYCALAMDLAGHGPNGRLPDGGPDQSDDTKFRDFDDKTVREMWTYHAVAAVLRGHNLLRALPEVDKDRVAVTGISWGGYLTCIIAGLDGRLKAAVPVYGCGFLHENSVWKESRFDKVAAARAKRWTDTFDPSNYLPNVKCPILFLNGTNDFAYPMDSYQKCYDLVQAPRTISVRVRLPHGHIWNFGEVDAFIDSHLNKGAPLPELGTMARAGDTVTAQVTSKTKLKSAQLHYATAEGTWQKRQWASTTADIKDGVVTAKLPAARPLVYELAVTDERGLEVTTTHAVLTAPTLPNSCEATPQVLGTSVAIFSSRRGVCRAQVALLPSTDEERYHVPHHR
ncbi:alpha/beta fold hydrolase [Gemmata sp. JC673]|uniref:Alpha/beta fold hydrolase n=1 Tax=Gemmata algarum TaxID=2975278 RepID=A0ABU5FCB4_9BACT|nr:alpha/beta fold hydrolase [Gemmata algarum]MDY3563459.1 alpha/beta fold hydrolase [Gemmata algarum]